MASHCPISNKSHFSFAFIIILLIRFQEIIFATLENIDRYLIYFYCKFDLDTLREAVFTFNISIE